MTHSTSGDPYEIDLCMTMTTTKEKNELCGSYLFKMPFIDDIDPTQEWDDLVLLEKDPLFDLIYTSLPHFFFSLLPKWKKWKRGK